MEYHYTITNDGDIKLICQISDERTQVVFINSQTQNYQEMEIREIFSPAALFSANNLTLPLAKKLLEENYNKKLKRKTKIKQKAHIVKIRRSILEQ